jgi:pimeloyl-ACP methyl ester carboxylesterase
MVRRCRLIDVVLVMVAFPWFLVTATGEEVSTPDQSRPWPQQLEIKTLGGAQFWSDVTVYGRWRIQRNALTGHFRLLDEKDIRRAWGTYDQCSVALDQWKQQRADLGPLRGKAVLVLHGLGRTRNSMSKLCRYLSEDGDYVVVNVSYASTRERIGEHASHLGQIIAGLADVEEIHFVGHSLGNLVIRHYLGDTADNPDPRIRRIVMLAPPNSGSRLARMLKESPLFRLFAGASGQQLSSQWESVVQRLATPQCEFGIIAGAKGKDTGRNPLLEGDDDLVVSVDETKLPGACDFVTLPLMHTFIMDDRTAQEYTLRFLREGYFIAADRRRPIPAVADNAPDTAIDDEER